MSTVAPKQNIKRDDKDTEIDKLKGVNARLRNRIKELNSKVEDAIEKASRKKVHNSSKDQKNKDPQHILNIRDKEIENAKRQIEMNDKEI